MPRSITARRALAARRRRDELETTSTKPAATRSRPAAVSWPSRITVAELDELAELHGVELDPDATKAEKQKVLEAAGVGPNGGADE
jgi:hypothetical protein